MEIEELALIVSISSAAFSLVSVSISAFAAIVSAASYSRSADAEYRTQVSQLTGLSDWIAGKNTFMRQPVYSGQEKWGIAAKQVSDFRKHIRDVLTHFGPHHPARKVLISLTDELRDFAYFHDAWVRDPEKPFTHEFEAELVHRLGALQKSMRGSEEAIDQIIRDGWDDAGWGAQSRLTRLARFLSAGRRRPATENGGAA